MLSIIYLVQIFKKWYEITKLHFKTLSNFLLHETLWSSHNIQLSLWMTKVCVCRDITVYLDKLDYHNFKYGGSNNLGCDGDHIQIIWKSVISLMKHEKTMLKKVKIELLSYWSYVLFSSNKRIWWSGRIWNKTWGQILLRSSSSWCRMLYHLKYIIIKVIGL